MMNTYICTVVYTHDGHTFTVVECTHDEHMYVHIVYVQYSHDEHKYTVVWRTHDEPFYTV